MPQRLTPQIIEAAIAGFEQRKQQTISELDAQISRLQAMLPGNNHDGTATEAAPRKRSKFSGAARKRMALAQKARWAKIRGDSEPSAQATPEPKPRRKLSAAGRRAISEATNKRWALKRAEAAKKSPAPRKVNAKRSTAAATTA